MKLLPAVFISFVADAKEKKVPPRHPTQRLKTLRRFAKEWLKDNFEDEDLSKAQAAAGVRNTIRFEKRIERRYNQLRWLALKGTPNEIAHPWNQDKDIQPCFFYDPEQPHGGRPKNRRKRDDGDDYDENLDDDYDFGKASDDLIRYDRKNPLRGLRQIMTGYRKWAERYVDLCPAEKQDKKLSKWANAFRKKIEDVYREKIINVE
jgi:hypothetical protein